MSAVVFAAASLRPLTHSELRYVESGAEMAASGDWIVPRLSYVPYFEKPILTYWLEAASQLAFGAGAIAVRLPSILACVAMVWTTWAFGRHLRGAAFAFGAGALLAASAVFQEMGTAVLTDAPFAAFLAFAWYAFRRHDREPSSRWIWAFWTSLGLAFLTKGPLAIALVGSTVGAYLVLAGRLRDCLSMRLVRGAAIVVAINLPWSVLVWRSDPRFLEFFYVRQNFQAMYDKDVNHEGPPWYYVPYVAGALFPFAALGAWALCVESWRALAPAVRRIVGRGGGAPLDEGRLYVACMLVPPLLLLSVVASKLGTYVLPLFPAMALLAATYVADRLAAPTRVLRFATLAQAVTFSAVGGVVVFAPDALSSRAHDLATAHEGAVRLVAATMLLPMLAGGLVMATGRILAGMTVVAAGAFASVVVVNAVAPQFGAERPVGDLVRRLSEVRAPGECVVVSGPLADDYALVLALGERPRIHGKTGELGMGHFTEVTPPSVPIPGDVYKIGDWEHPLPANSWLLDQQRLRAAWAGPARVWYVGRDEDVEDLRKKGFAMHVLAGKTATVVATNLPLPAGR